MAEDLPLERAEDLKEISIERLAVVDVDDMALRELSSIALRLIEKFPDKKENLEALFNGFLRSVHTELQLANGQLEDMGHEVLDGDQLDVVEKFYQVKAEKQLRGACIGDMKRATIQFLEAAAELLAKSARKNEPLPAGIRQPMVKETICQQNEEGEWTVKLTDELELNSSEVEAWAVALGLSFPEDSLNEKKRTKLETRQQAVEGQGGEMPHVLQEQLMEVIAQNPAVFDAFLHKFTITVAGRERYTKRKVHETTALVASLASRYEDGDRILDLCTGTGDIATIAKTLGYPVTGVDVNRSYLKAARAYNYVLRQYGTNEAEAHLAQQDVITSDLPVAELWVAKHPCARGLALPDKIIGKFHESTDAESLDLLTCCADKSIGCCPDEYKDAGLIDDEGWDELCRQACDVGSGEGEERIRSVQAAIRKINEIRVRYAQDYLGLHATIEEIPGTIMNQVIVLSKED